MKKSKNEITPIAESISNVKVDYKGWAIVISIFCTFFITHILVGGTISKHLHEKIIQRYYPVDEIKKDNLKILTGKTFQLKVSNGDILPQAEQDSYIKELFTRMIPFYLVWGIIFLAYLRYYKGKPKLSAYQAYYLDEQKRKNDKKKRKQMRLEQERQDLT